MLGNAYEILTLETTENHVYQFGNTFRKQSKGEPMGLCLTGEMADCYMTDWDVRLLAKLNRVKIKPIIYARFIDDINMLTKRLEKGSKYINGKIVIDESGKQLMKRQVMQKSRKQTILDLHSN